jgi:hypothetical protein
MSKLLVGTGAYNLKSIEINQLPTSPVRIFLIFQSISLELQDFFFTDQLQSSVGDPLKEKFNVIVTLSKKEFGIRFQA